MPATGEVKVREYHGWAVVNKIGVVLMPSIQPTRAASIRNYLAWQEGFNAINSMQTIRERWRVHRKEYGRRVEKIVITGRDASNEQ